MTNEPGPGANEDARPRSNADDRLVEMDGHLVIRASGVPLTAEDIRKLRLADQR